MKTRDHICIAGIGISGLCLLDRFLYETFHIKFLAFVLGVSPYRVPYTELMACVMISACLVDFDRFFVPPGKNHRDHSIAHTFEASLITLVVLLVFWKMVGKHSLFRDVTVSLALGWFFHIIGDVLQGGVKSWTLTKLAAKRATVDPVYEYVLDAEGVQDIVPVMEIPPQRIGFTSFTWDVYEKWSWIISPALFVIFFVTYYKTYRIVTYGFSSQKALVGSVIGMWLMLWIYKNSGNHVRFIGKIAVIIFVLWLAYFMAKNSILF